MEGRAAGYNRSRGLVLPGHSWSTKPGSDQKTSAVSASPLASIVLGRNTLTRRARLKMSREHIDALGQKAARDPALAAAIKAARIPADVASIGAKHGCDFTESELASYLGFSPDDELDDAKLDGVAGGASDGASAVHAGDLLLHRWQSSAGGAADASPWTVTHGDSNRRN